MAQTNSEPRRRLMATAAKIFYTEGIHAIGVDRIVQDAKVTRATFYRHFPSKEDLIVAYLEDADRAIRDQMTAAAKGRSGPEAVRAIAETIAEGIRSRGFRGCAFLNAAAEYGNPSHPAHRAVIAHRQWFVETVGDLLGDEAAARRFVMLRDGAMAAGCLADSKLVSETFLQAVDELLSSGTKS